MVIWLTSGSLWNIKHVWWQWLPILHVWMWASNNIASSYGGLMQIGVQDAKATDTLAPAHMGLETNWWGGWVGCLNIAEGYTHMKVFCIENDALLQIQQSISQLQCNELHTTDPHRVSQNWFHHWPEISVLLPTLYQSRITIRNMTRQKKWYLSAEKTWIRVCRP